MKTILEFGPGNSTQVFIEHTTAKILSLEANLQWYKQYKGKFNPERVQVIFLPSGGDMSIIYQYGEVFSLVFIDGVDRIDALKLAHEVVDNDGIVFLHDAHREDYEEGIRLYPFSYFPERHSCLLFNSEKVYEKVKAAVPTDYSCQCKYCSTPERQAYFLQFADQ